METIIVYLDDADYAQPLLQSLAQSPRVAQTQWVLVACAPRITHRVSKWVSNRTREQWRTKWADKLFAQAVPVLAAQGAAVRAVLARGPLTELLAELHAELGHAPQIVDVRRPKLDAPHPQAAGMGSAAAAQVAAPALEPVSLTGVDKPKLQWGRAAPSLLASLAGMCLMLEEVLL